MKQIGIALIVALLVASSAPAQTVKGDPQAWEELKVAMGRLNQFRTHRTRFGLAPGQARGVEMSMVSESVRPDRQRMVMRMEDMGMMEVVAVGREMRRRMTPLGRGAQMVQQQQGLFNQAFGGGIGNLIGWITDPVGSAVNLAISYVTSRIASTIAGVERPGLWKCTRLDEPSPTQQAQSSGGQSGPEMTVTKLGEGSVEGARTMVYEIAFPDRGETRKSRYHVLVDLGVPRRMEMLDSSGSVLGMMDYYDFDAPITIELPPCEQ